MLRLTTLCIVVLCLYQVCSQPLRRSAPEEPPKPATDEVSQNTIDKPKDNDGNTSENKDPANTPKEGQSDSVKGEKEKENPQTSEDDAKDENNQTPPDPKAENNPPTPETEEDKGKGEDKPPTLATNKINDQQSHNEAVKSSEEAPKENKDGEAKEIVTTAEQNKDDEGKDLKKPDDKPKEDEKGQEEHKDVGGEKVDKKPTPADQNEEPEDDNNLETSDEDGDETDGKSEEKTPEIPTDENEQNGDSENDLDEGAGASNEQDPLNSKNKDSDTKTYPQEENTENSHFFAYLVCAVILVAVLYIASHNKRKIIAFVVEGRRSRGTRRPKTSDYHKLDQN